MTQTEYVRKITEKHINKELDLCEYSIRSTYFWTAESIASWCCLDVILRLPRTTRYDTLRKTSIDPERMCATALACTTLYQLLHATFYVYSPDDATTGNKIMS